MDWSLQASLHGVFKARILEWIAFLSPGDLPDPEIEPASPTLEGRFFTTEPPGKPKSLHEQALIKIPEHRVSKELPWWKSFPTCHDSVLGN